MSDMLIEKAKKIKLLALDVDGVLTEGGITYDENGIEYKTFNVKDGQGIVRINNAGIVTAIITARNNGTVSRRAKDLKIKELHQGKTPKLPVLEEILAKYKLDFDNVAYVGDDLPDREILQKVGLACCPKDAINEVCEICDFISTKDGGHGAVREVCDFILNLQDVENKYL